MYFAWLGHFTYSLIFPAVLGVMVEVRSLRVGESVRQHTIISLASSVHYTLQYEPYIRLFTNFDFN